jgi:hypothetical protein
MDVPADVPADSRRTPPELPGSGTDAAPSVQEVCDRDPFRLGEKAGWPLMGDRSVLFDVFGLQNDRVAVPPSWISRCRTPVGMLLPNSTRRKTSSGCGTCEQVPTLRRQAGHVRGAFDVRGDGRDPESPDDRLRSIPRNRAPGPLRLKARIRSRLYPRRVGLLFTGRRADSSAVPRGPSHCVHGLLVNLREERHGRTEGEQPQVGRRPPRRVTGPRGGRTEASPDPGRTRFQSAGLFVPRSPPHEGLPPGRTGASLRRSISAGPDSLEAVASRRPRRRARRRPWVSGRGIATSTTRSGRPRTERRVSA